MFQAAIVPSPKSTPGNVVAQPVTAAPNVKAPTLTPAQAAGAGNFQRFEDNAMASARRHLDPIWDQQGKTFEQSMVNKGLAPDSEAYRTAFDNFSRAKNDQYTAAAYGAQDAGLRAQNQYFGQNLANANLQQQGDMFNVSNALNADIFNTGRTDEMNKFNAGNQLNADIFNTNAANDRSKFSQNLAMQGDMFRQNMDLQRYTADRGFDLQGQHLDLARTEADRAFDLNETNMLANIDFGYGDRAFRDQQYNDSRGDVQYNRLASILSGISQQATPQVDVMGAYGLNTSANNANYAAGMGGYNAGLGGMANLGSSLINLWGMS